MKFLHRCVLGLQKIVRDYSKNPSRNSCKQSPINASKDIIEKNRNSYRVSSADVFRDSSRSSFPLSFLRNPWISSRMDSWSNPWKNIQKKTRVILDESLEKFLLEPMEEFPWNFLEEFLQNHRNIKYAFWLHSVYFFNSFL